MATVDTTASMKNVNVGTRSIADSDCPSAVCAIKAAICVLLSSPSRDSDDSGWVVVAWLRHR